MKIGMSNYNIMNSFHKSDTQEVYGVCLLTGVVLAHTVTAEGRDLLANIMVDLSAKNTVPVDFIFGGENGDQTTEPDSPESEDAANDDDEKSDIPPLEMSEIAEAVAGVLSDQDSYPDVEYIDVLDSIDPLNPDAVEDKVLALASANVDFIASELDVDPREVNAVLDDVPSGWMTLS